MVLMATCAPVCRPPPPPYPPPVDNFAAFPGCTPEAAGVREPRRVGMEALAALLQDHGLSERDVAAVVRASGAEHLEDLSVLDSEGAAEVVRGAKLKPVAASRLRRALHGVETAHAGALAVATLPVTTELTPIPTAAQINAQLAKGGVVRLPPGVIEIDRPLLMGVSGTVLEGLGPGVTTLRLKKTGEIIQMLTLLYGVQSSDGKSVLHTSGLTVRNLTLDGGQSASEWNPVVGIDDGPSSLDMNCCMGIYASDVLVADVTIINHYGAITMGALPAAMPIGTHTDANGNWRFLAAKGNQPMNSNVRVSGVTTHGVNGSYPGNYGPDKKMKYAMVCISNGTAQTAIVENCTVNDADYAFNTEEMTETTTHFVNCTAMNSKINAFELQSSALQTLTNCVAYSTHRDASVSAHGVGVFYADTPTGIVSMTNCCSFGSWDCNVFYIMSPYHTLTNCHANGVHVEGSTPFAAFRMAPHIIIAGVGPTLCNCQASDVDGEAAYQLYENDSPQTYSIVNSYLSAKRRITSTSPRHVRAPDVEERAGMESGEDEWELLEDKSIAKCEC